MGQHVLNFSINTDYATPEKDTVVELHMALSIPFGDLQKLQNWLQCNDWTSARQYLTSKYPEHRKCLEDWMAGSEARSLEREKHKLMMAA